MQYVWEKNIFAVGISAGKPGCELKKNMPVLSTEQHVLQLDCITNVISVPLFAAAFDSILVSHLHREKDHLSRKSSKKLHSTSFWHSKRPGSIYATAQDFCFDISSRLLVTRVQGTKHRFPQISHFSDD